MTDDILNDGDDDLDLQIDENKNYLEELVGPGKKFATVEDMAKGKYVGDIHAKSLERNMAELREDYIKLREQNETGQKLQDLLDKIEKAQNLSSRDNTHNSNEDEINNKPSFDPTQVESLVSSQVQKIRQTEKEQENSKVVRDKLQEHFGRNYKDVLKEHAELLDLSDEQVNSMAKTNPKLFFKTFGLDQPKSENFQTPPSSSVRKDNFSPSGSKKRDWNYYQELKKRDPKLYYAPKTLVQMDRDAQELGDDFGMPPVYRRSF